MFRFHVYLVFVVRLASPQGTLVTSSEMFSTLVPCVGTAVLSPHLRSWIRGNVGIPAQAQRVPSYRHKTRLVGEGIVRSPNRQLNSGRLLYVHYSHKHYLVAKCSAVSKEEE